MRLLKFCRALAVCTLALLLSPILALDGKSSHPCTIRPFAVALQCAPSQESRMPSARISAMTRRVLLRLEQAELSELNPHLRDDYRIAWIVALYAMRGDLQPLVSATYRVLGVHPDTVWDATVARRKTKLGKEYFAWYDAAGNLVPDSPALALPPKKPVQIELRLSFRENRGRQDRAA